MAEVFEFFEEKLMEEVRRCRHLYDATTRLHSDREAVANAWQEIAKILSSDSESCKRRWKQLRDRYVRARKRVKSERSGDIDSMVAAPGIIRRLSWLSDFIKHRTTDTNILEKVTESQDTPEEEHQSEVTFPKSSPAESPITPVSTSSTESQLSQRWESPVPTPTSQQPQQKRKRVDPAEAMFKRMKQTQEHNDQARATNTDDSGHCASKALSEFCQKDSRVLRRSFEEKLIEEVRRCRHLYDNTMQLHSDREAVEKTWREISKNLSCDTESCRKGWKQLRDRYVRARKKMKSVDGAAALAVSGIFCRLNWLSDFIKHRSDNICFPDTASESQDTPEEEHQSEGTFPKSSPAESPITPVSTSSAESQLSQRWESPVPTPTSQQPQQKRKRVDPAGAMFKSLAQIKEEAKEGKATMSDENAVFGHYVSSILSTLSQKDSRVLRMRMHQVMFDFMESVE